MKKYLCQCLVSIGMLCMLSNTSLAKSNGGLDIKQQIQNTLKVNNVDKEILVQALDTKVITMQQIYESKNSELCLLANQLAETYDYDNDGLTDYEELFKYYTNPLEEDSDNDGIIDSDWGERKEYTYTVEAQVRIHKVYEIKEMQGAYQDAKLLKETDDYAEIAVILYPESHYNEQLYGKTNWKNDNKEMEEYLITRPLANWDEQLQKDLQGELNRIGIYPERISDLELIKRLTFWIETTNKRKFGGEDLFFTLENNKLELSPRYKNYLQDTNQDINIDNYYGKNMYYKKVIGECSSSATYYATIFRAVGIPTRIKIMTPMVAGDSAEQKKLIESNIINPQIKNKLIDGLMPGWGNHFYTQAYIGNRWVDIEYANVGYNFGLNAMGNMVINTIIDWSDFTPIAQKEWYDQIDGKRNSNFSSWMPYDLLDIKDEYPIHKMKDK